MYTVFHYHPNGIRVMEQTRMSKALTDAWPDGCTDTQNFRGYNIKPCHVLVVGHKKDIILLVIHLFQSQNC